MSGPPPRRATAARLAVTVAVVFALAGVGASVAASENPDATVVARYPADNGSMVEETVVSSADIANVSAPQQSRTGDWQVPVTLTESGAESFTETVVDAGFTSNEGISTCPADAERNDEGYCLLTVVDGEVVYAAAMGPELANVIETGEFEQNPRFVMLATNETMADRIAASLGVDSNAGTSATTTETDTAAPTNAGDGTTAPGPTDGDDGQGTVPGFGVSAVLAALAASIGLAATRR